MSLDLNKLSTEELHYISSNQLEKLSTPTLKMLSESGAMQDASPQPSVFENALNNSIPILGIAKSMDNNKVNPTFPVSDNPVVRNTIDPILQLGTEAARASDRGLAAVSTPIAALGKILRVPEKYNLFEQSRNYYDAKANELPTTSVDPVSKLAVNAVGEAPGQVAAFEQVAPVLKPMIEGLSSILKSGKTALTERALVKQTAQSTKEADLSQKFLDGIENTRAKVGKLQGDWIDAHATELGDSKKLVQTLDNLPKPLQDEIVTHPDITKTDGVVDPTLKNLETIRGIIKGRVPAAKWNYNAVDIPAQNAANAGYDSIGKIMREGRPELAKLMGNYSEVMDAVKELNPQFQTNRGFAKSKPVSGIYSKGAESAKQQAIDVLLKHNPDMAIPRNQALALAKSKEFQKMVGKVLPPILKGGAGLVGLKILGDGLKNIHSSSSED